ncbi:MAG: RsmB/NOP family class I SAM-dependent RNA methyltransferase, partial [Pseudomonadota bacterium]
PDLAPAEAADLPDWLWSVFEADLGADAMPVAEAQKHRAPIALRVNLKMNTAAQAIDNMLKCGISARPVSDVPSALIVTSGERKIRQSTSYLSGEVELQDVSSQAAMARVNIPAGARVLDICAGGGGKTLALAAALPDGAGVRFFAHDINPDRMVDLPSRAARAEVQVTCLAPEDLPIGPDYDVVLCDVPCSGSGTWRRSPDAKWALTQERLGNFIETQRDILLTSCERLRPGGQLIYTTCSVLRRENEDQISWLTGARNDMERRDEMRWPVRAEGDGFYFAALRRKN